MFVMPVLIFPMSSFCINFTAQETEMMLGFLWGLEVITYLNVSFFLVLIVDCLRQERGRYLLMTSLNTCTGTTSQRLQKYMHASALQHIYVYIILINS